MGLKRFEVEIEVIQIREVTVWADNFGDASEKAKSFKVDEVIKEGCLNDFEMRQIGVRRNKDSRMYQ